MRNTVIIYIITLICFTTFLEAQTKQGSIEMDAIAFARDSGKVQVEIYYSIAQGALRFEQKDKSWIALINVRAEIWDNGHVVAMQDVKKEVTHIGSKASLDSLNNSLRLGGVALTSVVNTNGTAVLIFRSKNVNGTETIDTIKRPFFSPVGTKDKFYMGGIELANSLVPSNDHTNPFEKVGYIIAPNPSKVFNANNSKLNYYTELYIPQAAVSSSANVVIVTRVLDGAKHEMFSNSHQQVLSSTVIPLIGSIDIDGLPTDSYILEIAVKRGTVTEAAMEKVFFYDSGMKLSEDQADAAPSAALDEEVMFSTSDINKMTQLELEEKGDQAMYIAPAEKGKEWKKLKLKLETDEAQALKENDIISERRFLYQFWRAKDKEEGSAVPLQAYKLFYKHVEEANKKFTYQRTAGWKTDRGRIYITYGAPEERYIISQLHTTEAKPYITWEYYDKKLPLTVGSHPIFAFVDIQGGGKFILVHSNVLGETYEPNWYTQEAKRTN